MGPPREHGGMQQVILVLAGGLVASMGPPREHGGMRWRARGARAAGHASMGPPREHGGMGASITGPRIVGLELQWGRRVNTAECAVLRKPPSPLGARFNGAAA